MMKRLITSDDGHIPEDSRYVWAKDDVEKVDHRTHGWDTHSSMDLHIGHFGGEDRMDRQDSREEVHSGHPMGHHEMVHGQEEERNDRVGRSNRVVESDGGIRELGYTHDVESRSSHRHD